MCLQRLETQGYVISVRIAEYFRYKQNVPSYCLTEQGIGRLAEIEGIEVDDVYRSYPVSLQWRRVAAQTRGGA